MRINRCGTVGALALGAISLVAASSARAAFVPAGVPTPILEYTFNDAANGVNSVSTGSNTTAVTFYNSSLVATDLHGAAGTGVSGLSGDRSFDNSASAGMGNGSGSQGGGLAKQAADLDAIDALRSWTISGWFKTAGTTQFMGYAHLYDNVSGGSGFSLTSEGTTGDNVQVQMDSSATTAVNGVGYSATQKWVYFAVSYDGTQTTNNFKFYRGYTDSAVTLMKTASYNVGAMNDETAAFVIGNRLSDRIRPFDGYLDNFRVFGGKASASDSSGALSLADLEAIRAYDVTGVPEPATLGVLAVTGAAMLMRRRRGNLA